MPVMVTNTMPLAGFSLLPIARAAALKASNVLLPEVGAFILPTMPNPQWVILKNISNRRYRAFDNYTCLQWNQIATKELIVPEEIATR